MSNSQDNTLADESDQSDLAGAIEPQDGNVSFGEEELGEFPVDDSDFNLTSKGFVADGIGQK